MRRDRFLLAIAPAAAALLGGLLLVPSARPILLYRYPDVRPVFQSEDGWNWERLESDNGYSWIFREDEWRPGNRPRTGLGLFLGPEVGPAETDHAIGRAPGRIGAHEVEWFLERHHSGGTPVRRAVFEYRHGPGTVPIGVHVWVWGLDDDDVKLLLAKLETMRFVDRERP
jgi:hypothetical protein